MDELMKVEIEVDKVLRLFASNRDQSKSAIDKLLETIANKREQIHQCTQPDQSMINKHQALIIDEIGDTIKKTCFDIQNSHRDLHVPVTKIGKSIDKNFSADYSSVADSDLFETPENKNLLCQAIVEHLLRRGMIDVANELIKDTKISFNSDRIEKFVHINNILSALRNKDIRPVFDWAIKNRQQLAELGSTLEFRIHRANINELFKHGVDKQHEIIQYARKYFQNVDTKYNLEIQQLMGCILYLKSGVQSCPYLSILKPIKYEELEDLFIKDALAWIGINEKSPISVALDAGAIALPALLNINEIMMRQGVQNVWQLRDELPVEIDLGKKLHFHSTFSCPILRQQGTENNPPMRLTCGHVISRDALHKLSTNAIRLKCPYCPVEFSVADAKQIYI